MTGLELASVTRDDEAVIPSQSQAPQQASQPAVPPMPPLDQQQWAATAMARPLFARNRRPVTVAAGVTAAPVLPRLSGVLIDGGNRRAIFAGLDGGRPAAVTEGGEVAGFRVQRIEAGQVTLLGPDGPRVLRPSFGRQPAGAAPPRPAMIGLPGLDSLRNLTGLPDPAPGPAR